MVYPYLELHILFYSNGLAIWSGFPDTTHLKKIMADNTHTMGINESCLLKTESQSVSVRLTVMSLTVGLTLHLPLHGSAVLPQSQSDTVIYDDLHSQIESFLLNIIGAYTM